MAALRDEFLSSEVASGDERFRELVGCGEVGPQGGIWQRLRIV
jgi:hypothetical protein